MTLQEKFSKPFDKDTIQKSKVFDLMPSYSELHSKDVKWDNKWERAVSTWFFDGIAKSRFTPKAGIDVNDAFYHLGNIIGDWTPKHEHKTDGAAFLMSLWFDDVKLN